MTDDDAIRQGVERLGFRWVPLQRVRVICGACSWFHEADELDAANAAGRHWHDAHAEEDHS